MQKCKFMRFCRNAPNFIFDNSLLLMSVIDVLQYDLADCTASFYNVNAVVERYYRFGAIGGIVNGFPVGREYGNVARYV